MNMEIHSDPAPLRVTDGGAIRIGASQVLLDVLISHYKQGASPEALTEWFPSVPLADVHAVIAYYLRHKVEVEQYLAEREREAERMKALVQKTQAPRGNLKAELQARLSRENTGHAPTGG